MKVQQLGNLTLIVLIKEPPNLLPRSKGDYEGTAAWKPHSNCSDKRTSKFVAEIDYEGTAAWKPHSNRSVKEPPNLLPRSKGDYEGTAAWKPHSNRSD